MTKQKKIIFTLISLSISGWLNLSYANSDNTSSDPDKKINSISTKGFSTPVVWDNKTLWDASQAHSNNFYIKNAWNAESGSFASEISSEGKVLSEKRHLIASSRMIYGLAHSAQIDPTYLGFAEREAQFLLQKMTDQDQDGIYFKSIVDAKGNSLTSDDTLIVNAQAYGLNGLVALYKVTKNPELLQKIEVIYDDFYHRFHDPVNMGFFDGYDRKARQAVKTKSFNSTVYVATSFLFELAQLPTSRQEQYVKTATELADIVATNFIDSKTNWIIENFSSDWKPEWRDWQVQGDSTIGITGHNYQAAWLLMRATEFSQVTKEKKTQYLESAKLILSSMLKSKSLDLENGGFFDAFKRESDEPMWHTNKAWWQQAEAILALTKADQLNLFKKSLDFNIKQVRDQALRFYFAHFIDYQNGGEFPVVQKDGTPVLTENKGQLGTGTYHQVELAKFMKEYALQR